MTLIFLWECDDDTYQGNIKQHNFLSVCGFVYNHIGWCIAQRAVCQSIDNVGTQHSLLHKVYFFITLQIFHDCNCKDILQVIFIPWIYLTTWKSIKRFAINVCTLQVPHMAAGNVGTLWKLHSLPDHPEHPPPDAQVWGSTPFLHGHPQVETLDHVDINFMRMSIEEN